MTSGEVAEEVLQHDFHGSFRHPARRFSSLRCKYADVGVGTDLGNIGTHLVKSINTDYSTVTKGQLMKTLNMRVKRAEVSNRRSSLNQK